MKKQKALLREQLAESEKRIFQLEQRNDILQETIAEKVAENRRLKLVIAKLGGPKQLPDEPLASRDEAALKPAVLDPQYRASVTPIASRFETPIQKPELVQDDDEGDSRRISQESLRAINAQVAPAIILNTSNLFHRGYHITDEQQHGLDLAKTGADLKIEAGAGTGKTSNLSAISHEQSHLSGLYLAFNSPVVKEARKVFHRKTQCSTTHGVAFAALGYQYSSRLDARLTAAHVIKALNLPDYQDISAWTIAHVIMAWVYRYAQGGSEELGLDDAPWSLLKSLTREAEKEKATIVAQSYARDLQHYAANLWHKLADIDGLLPVNPDIYLKAWALSKPKLEFDYILYDEAQDASGVMMNLINDQEAQKIWVGDRRQQIYAWRGAVNAMDKIKTENECSLTRSFRFGQPIAELANCVLRKFLNDRDFLVVGSPHVKSVIGEVKNPKAFICRTNRTAIAELMRALGKGLRVHLDVGVYELISDIQSAQALKEGRRPRSPELQVFKTWDEVIAYSRTEVGSDLKPLVKMLDRWQANVLLQALEKTKSVKAEDADITIATAHRSKGKEYTSVKLGSDFPWPATGEQESKHRFTQEDAYLLYVALTRAMHELDIGECRAAQIALESSF